MRIDAGGDCAAIYAAAHRAGARFIGKAKLSADLCGAIQCTTKWRTVERDAFGQPATQVAEICFARDAWKELGYPFRVVAMRTRERDNGKQIQLWSDLDYTVQAFVTNDWTADAEDIAFEYDGRAEVEPAIGELKSGWGIGKIPSQDFRANHAVFLLKLLAHNLMRRFVRWTAPHLSSLARPVATTRAHQHPRASAALGSALDTPRALRSRASASTDTCASPATREPPRLGGKGAVSARSDERASQTPPRTSADAALARNASVIPRTRNPGLVIAISTIIARSGDIISASPNFGTTSEQN